MGFPQKSQVDGTVLDSAVEAQKWVVAGMVPPKQSLAQVRTRSTDATTFDEEVEESCTTPTSPESRIPVKVPCPAAPTKPKAKTRCAKLGAQMEFLTPQDLQSAFTITRHVSK